MRHWGKAQALLLSQLILLGLAGLVPSEGLAGTTHEEAVAKVREMYRDGGRVFYDFHRVEICGVNSSDDTNEIQPGMFDEQIKLSHREMEGTTSGSPRSLWGRIRDLARDIGDAYHDLATKAPSQRAQEIFSALKEKEIQELYAHSWGVEAVYSGIYKRTILPPKRLVLIGAPETDRVKWELLSRTTGTEVIFVTAAGDLVHGAKEMAEGTLEALATSAETGPDKRSLLRQKLDRQGWEGDWEDWCFTAPVGGCPAHGRKGGFHAIRVRLKDAGPIGHERAAYYRELNELKWLMALNCGLPSRA